MRREALSVCLPHSLKHHIRYLNCSFWQWQGQTFLFSWPIVVFYFPFSGSWLIFPPSFSFFRETQSRRIRVWNAQCFNSSKQPFSRAPNVMLCLRVVRVSFREYWRAGLAAEDTSAVTLEPMVVSPSLCRDNGLGAAQKEKGRREFRCIYNVSECSTEQRED